MKDLTKYFIDLSKCTEEQRKHLFSLLPEPEYDHQYLINHDNFMLHFLQSTWWVFNYGSKNKQELTYPEFIKLFEGEEDNVWITFTERMEKELQANAYKGDWRVFATKENRPEILSEIEHHYNKLVMAYESGDEELIREHSADIGNIAMFMYESTNSK